MDARLLEIYIATRVGAPMQPMKCVEALAGRGLEADRYLQGTGTYSKFPGAHNVTLLES